MEVILSEKGKVTYTGKLSFLYPQEPSNIFDKDAMAEWDVETEHWDNQVVPEIESLIKESGI